MKTRILSLVLAVIMVVSMAAVFSVSSSAEDEFGVTVTLGNAYVTPDDTVAYLDVYVSADALPEGYDHLRNWEFVFEGANVTEGSKFYVSGDNAFGFTNTESNTIGNSANSGYNVGTLAQVTSRGGWKIASIAFAVSGAAGDEIDVSIATVNALSAEKVIVGGGEEGKDAYEQYKLAEKATVAAGKIYVVEAAAAEAVVGAGEDLYVPAFVDGKKVTIDADTYTGEFGDVYIAAPITDAFVEVFEADAENYVIKNPDFEDITDLADGNGVYYHKKANGATPIVDAYDGLSAKQKKKVTFFENILAVKDGAAVAGDEVTFVAGLNVKDLWYDDLTIVVEIAETGKVYEASVKKVYTTLNGIASVDADTATADGIDAVDMAYINGLTLFGVPAGTFTANVTLFGTTDDVSGTPIVVCSDTAVIPFTVG
ncbi:MAG: hypothetical protein IJU52_00820 [Clostridia bacterium]|nr:hypothetical protein [Clostridia bacterium]